MSRLLAGLALFALLVTTPQQGAALCMAPQLVVRSGTPDGTVIVPGGHPMITVGNGRAPSGSFSESTRELELTSAGASVRARIDWIVPGLARLVPPAPLGVGVHDITEAVERTSITVGPGALPPALAAPHIRTVQRTETSTIRALIVNVAAQLSAPVPAGAVFTVARWRGGGTFAPAATGLSETPLFASPGRCGSTYEGHTAPSVGARIEIAFVDAQGRVGAWSRPIVVR